MALASSKCKTSAWSSPEAECCARFPFEHLVASARRCSPASSGLCHRRVHRRSRRRQPRASSRPRCGATSSPSCRSRNSSQHMIDPASDYIFDSVSTVIDPKGAWIGEGPKTDQDWEKLPDRRDHDRRGVYLLKVQRPFAPPGDENNSVGPDASELSPAQILRQGPRRIRWSGTRGSRALRNVGLEVLEIVKKKNVPGVVGRGRKPRRRLRTMPRQLLVSERGRGILPRPRQTAARAPDARVSDRTLEEGRA